MTSLTIPLDQILVTDRLREDVGDIDSLAASLECYGQLQPLLITQNNELADGFRRLTALKKLGRTHAAVFYKESMSEDERREWELEANVRRKDMDWKEKVKAIAYIHRIKSRNAALASESWGYRETGELLGFVHSQVSYACDVAEALTTGDKELNDCSNLSEALRVLLRRKQDEAVRLLADKSRMAGTPSLIARLNNAPLESAKPGEKVRLNASHCLRHADCLKLWKDATQWPVEGENTSYIITDPPYAIETENMDQHVGLKNIETVKAEHQVVDNLRLLDEFIPAAYHELRDPGWLLMFCDPDLWNYLNITAEEAGFRVQRWPLVWVKTHPCGNAMANKNWTKSVEFVLVASKGNASLLSPQPTCHFSASNDDYRDKSGHPFSKPIAVWQWLIKAVVPLGHAFDDPFAGRGSSHIAAIRCGRHCVSVESNETHYAHLRNNVIEEYETIYGKDNLEVI